MSIDECLTELGTRIGLAGLGFEDNRACTLVFEGKPIGTPHAGVFWKIIQNHRVKSFFTAPTALRAIKREDPEGEWIKRYKLHDLQALFLEQTINLFLF